MIQIPDVKFLQAEDKSVSPGLFSKMKGLIFGKK